MHDSYLNRNFIQNKTLALAEICLLVTEHQHFSLLQEFIASTRNSNIRCSSSAFQNRQAPNATLQDNLLDLIFISHHAFSSTKTATFIFGQVYSYVLQSNQFGKMVDSSSRNRTKSTKAKRDTKIQPLKGKRKTPKNICLGFS